jgi:hypothetical protein
MIPNPTIPFIVYIGSGSPTTYAITFPTFEEANIEVEVKDDTGAFIAAPSYLLSDIGIPNQFAKLDFTVPLPLNYEVKISFTTLAQQPAKFRELGRFAPETFEKALDRLTMNTLALRQVQADENAAEALQDDRLDAIEILDIVQDLSLNDHEVRISALEASATVGATVSLQATNFNAAYNFIYVITGTVNAQLPAPIANGSIQFKLNGSGPVTLVRAAGESIDFVAANQVLSAINQSYTLVSNGTDWYIV